MKNLFVILAVVAMAGCTNMPWRSSSGSMSSSGMESRSSSGATAVQSEETTRGMYNPYNASGEFPVPIIGP